MSLKIIKKMKQIIKVILILLGFFPLAHSQSPTPTPANLVSKNLQDIATPRSVYPKNLQILNNELYQTLLDIGVKPKVKKSMSEIKLLNLSCLIKTFTQCEYQSLHNNESASLKNIKIKKTTKTQSPAAEKLRMLLSQFPVAQGDSGASTPYLECQKWGSEPPSCSLAIQVNYEGP